MSRALILLPLLSACTMFHPSPPPAPVIPTAWLQGPTTHADWPSTAWWKAFQSPVLDRLIADAEGGSFDIRAAAARVRQADAAASLAGAPLLPTVTTSGGETWSRSSSRSSRVGSITFGGGGAYRETRQYDASYGASYEIDLWGRLRANRDAAAADALATRFDLRTAALTAVASVADTWFQALASQDRIDVARRNLADAEQVLAAIRARQEAGTTSLLEVSQQEALVAGLRAQIPGLQGQLVQQVNALAVLVGRNPEALGVTPDTLTNLAAPNIAAGLPSELLSRRPDVAAAVARLAAADADVRAARAALFPQVSLTGSGGWSAFALTTLFGPGSVVAQAALSVSQTVFDNGAKSAQVEQVRGRYDELLADYGRTVVQAFTDVENALAVVATATEQEAREREAVATAQRAADIARAQLLAGTSDIVTALQAQTTLFNDLDLLVQARLSRFRGLVALYRALGGGFAASDVAAPDTRLLQGIL